MIEVSAFVSWAGEIEAAIRLQPLGNWVWPRSKVLVELFAESVYTEAQLFVPVPDGSDVMTWSLPPLPVPQATRPLP